MSIVRFHHICDKCSAHGDEYSAFRHCSECMDDLCPKCTVPETVDDDNLEALCFDCAVLATE